MSLNVKIDTHSHFVPPDYRQALLDNGHANPDGMPAIPPWSLESHLEMMTTLNVTKSILSITSPGVHLVAGNDDLSRKLARYCNEYASNLKKTRPSQFGFFASLPLPDVEGSLAEIAYALDTLDADGFVLETNIHGIYLGDARFDAVFAELNRRNTIVFIHPTTPCMHLAHQDTPTVVTPLPAYPRPIFEFPMDSARALINLFYTGTVSRYPDITYILSHLGGVMAPLIPRFATIPSLLGLSNVDPAVVSDPSFVRQTLNSKQFYYDTAGWALPEQIRMLLQYVGVERIVYGSDFPFTPLRGALALSEDHDKFLPEVFERQEDRDALCRGNATRLLEVEKVRK